jgi:ketosteroid isomerase-like protein
VAVDDARAVEVANTAFYNAIEHGDLDLMEALWLDGSMAPDVVSVHPGWPMLRGRGEVMRAWAAVMAATPYIQFFLTDVQTRVAEDVAIVTCSENVLTGVEGSEGVEGGFGFTGGRIVATNVFRRTSDGWRLWVHHASPVMNITEDDDELSDGDDGATDAGEAGEGGDGT